MKKKQKTIILALLAILFLVILAVNLIPSHGEPLEDGIRVAENTELTYYLDIMYDGKDKSLTSSSDTAIAEVNSDYIYIEDRLPDGLIFLGFVETSDGTIGAVRRSDTSQSCAGYVVGGVDGLQYDEATRMVSFRISNLQAGCKITVGIRTRTPFLGEYKRRDFYNTAYGREYDLTIKSNTVHVFMGRDDLPLYTVNYQYSGTVPENAPELPNGGSYAEGSTVGVAQDLTLEGYEFSGWSTSDVSVSNGTFTMPGGNVTFYGSFVAKETHDVIYTVTGETPTGYEPPQTASYGAGDDVEMDSLKAGDEVNGYRFSGWTTTSSIDITDGIFQMPEEDVTFTGSFERISYTVSYQFQGSVIPDNAEALLPPSQEYYPGDRVIVADDPEAPLGYKFLGWYQSEYFEMPAADVVIYGEWMQEVGQFSPTITKQITNPQSSYSNGEIVQFAITITNTADFAIRDIMVQENTDGANFIAGDNYTLLNEKFVRVPTLDAHSSITIQATYTAGSDVVKEVTNEVELTGAIADNNYTLDTSKEYKASVTFTIANISLTINKVDEEGQPLTGAEFSLYSDADMNQFVSSGLNFTHLEPNTTYYLKETKVPIGYTILSELPTVNVSSQGVITIDGYDVTNTSDGNYQVTIANEKINILPNTGGSGNLPYIVIGLVIIIASILGYGIYLYKKKGGNK